MDRDSIYYLLFHGHSLDLNFSLDPLLGDYIEYLIDHKKKYIPSMFLYPINLSKIVNKSNKYLNNIFNIHDIGYINDRIVEDNINGIEVSSFEEAANIYNNSKVSMSPFDLPISFENKSQYYANLIVETPFVDDDYIKLFNVYFSEIRLNNLCNRLLIPIYIHEIIHTQLESNKGIVEKVYNREVLPIFIELLYSFDNRIDYKTILYERLNSLLFDFNIVCKTNFNNDNKDFNYMISTSYLVSTIKTLKLLDIYIHSSSKIKKELLLNIQKIFDGINSLEYYLSKYDITYESSKDTNVLKRIL